MGRLWKILFFSCTISICFSLPGFPHPVESMEKRVLKRLLSKGFAPCGQETRLSRAKWYLHPLSILDKGKKTVESFRKSSLFSMGFPKVFLVCCKHVKPFSTVSTSPTTTTEINMQLQQQWLSEVSKNEV